MASEEQNIANIFFPEQKLSEEGLLVGFNFEGFLIVITSVIPWSAVKNVEELQQILQEQKFQAFNKYCASELLIIGIVESDQQSGNESQLSKRADVLQFKQDQNIWITIRKQVQNKQTMLELKDLIICEYKYKVTPHFIIYPKQNEGEFLSITKMNYGEIINRSREWDQKTPYIAQNELFAFEDLTENDIIIRQINCSRILNRLLSERIKNPKLKDQPFQTEKDFYGRENKWLSLSIPTKLLTLIYLIIYLPYRLALTVSWIFKPLKSLNTAIQLNKKLENYRKVKNYIKLLREKNINEHLYFDNHYYKMSLYVKMASLIVQFVIDIALGLMMLYLLSYKQQEILKLFHYFGSGLHVEVLERQVKWLMGLPAGFKPNPNLDNFLGHLMLDIIGMWNFVTTEITQLEPLIIKYFALSGLMGINIQVALCHDMLFFCSAHIFILYTVFAGVYKYILQMMGTLVRLFRGKKYNVLRKRLDGNNFQIQELYLGVLIVSLIIFLTPTIAMYYYVCFITIILSILLIQTFLLIIQIFVSSFPFYLLSMTISRPYVLPNSFTLEINEKTCQFKIKPNSSNSGSVYQHFFGEFGQGLSNTFVEASPIKIIAKVIYGDNLIYVMRNLLNISTRVNEIPSDALQKGQNPNKQSNMISELLSLIKN